MSEMRASRKPFSSKVSLAAVTSRARVRAPLVERGPGARSGDFSAASDVTSYPGSSVRSDRRGVDAQQPRQVAAHELADGLCRELLAQLVDRRLRMGQALRVRPVGAEQHVVLTEELRDLAEVVLPERADVDRSLHRLDGVFGELHRHLLVDALELAHQRADPA